VLKTVKWLAIVALGLIGVLLTAGLFLPAEFRVERSIVVEASTERIHSLVGDLEQWPAWSPWPEMDPSIKVVYGEKTTGTGAHQTWSGKSGNGALTFTECDPRRGVAYDLYFDDGQDKSLGSIRYEELPEGTRVTWTMSGDFGANIPGRYVGLLMDSVVGKSFESGLAKLKERAETPS
jgi:hypothetical protein